MISSGSASDNPGSNWSLSVKNLSFSYRANPTPVLSSIDLCVAKGEIVALSGPNGCGKTTLLRCLIGLEPDWKIGSAERKIAINGRVGYVPQDYSQSLLPWRNAVDNIGLPLLLGGTAKREARKKVDEVLDRYRIDIPRSNYPYQMSGGERQKTALARSLVIEPEILVLDEPFSSLDAESRDNFLDKLVEIWRQTKIAVLFTSHSVDDAIAVADRVVVLSKRPAKNLAEIALPNERNRGTAFLLEPTSLEYKKQLLQTLQAARAA